jgi:hypothetical protein
MFVKKNKKGEVIIMRKHLNNYKLYINNFCHERYCFVTYDKEKYAEEAKSALNDKEMGGS